MTTPNGVLEAVGSPAISMAEVAGLVGEALGGAPAGERRFLVLVPDSTRKAPVAEVFRAIHDAVDGRADRVDAMIAQGTHGPCPKRRSPPGSSAAPATPAAPSSTTPGTTPMP